MRIRCPACSTAYEVDAALIGADGARVACGNCGRVSRVTRRVTTSHHLTTATAWVVQRQQGEQVIFPSLRRLRDEVRAGHLGRQDRLRRNRGGWTALGDLGELQADFPTGSAASSMSRPVASEAHFDTHASAPPPEAHQARDSVRPMAVTSAPTHKRKSPRHWGATAVGWSAAAAVTAALVLLVLLRPAEDAGGGSSASVDAKAPPTPRSNALTMISVAEAMPRLGGGLADAVHIGGDLDSSAAAHLAKDRGLHSNGAAARSASPVAVATKRPTASSATATSATSTTAATTTSAKPLRSRYAIEILAGRQMLRARQLERAQQHFSVALRRNPQGVEALYGLGYLALRGNDSATAMRHFQYAVGLGYADGWLGVASVYRVRKQPEDAIRAYVSFLQLRPRGDRAAFVRQQVQLLRQRLMAEKLG